MKLPGGETFSGISRLLRDRSLHTVCEEARCPNLGECWAAGTATLMILGDVCTRGCAFCAVRSGNPRGRVDVDEPRKVAEACEGMELGYLVLTSVDRDDLLDGGAAQFAACVRAAKDRVPGLCVECLVPDFAGDEAAIDAVLASGVDVFAHNLETVRRLSPRVRDPRCCYTQSLEVLATAKRLRPSVVTKSSIMLGLGESEPELDEAMGDLLRAGVTILTLGQYLQPTRRHARVAEYVTPARFDALRSRALKKGFAHCSAGPLVRSSYRAAESYARGRVASGSVER